MIITVTFNPSYDKTLEVADFVPDAVHMAKVIRRQPAGKGVNVSGCLASLGRSSIVTGFIGEAEYPAFAKAFHATETVVDFVSVDRETRQNVTILDPLRKTVTHIREEGFAVSANEVAALEKKLNQLVKEGDLVVFAGSLSSGMNADIMAALIKQCKGAGCYVAVDSSREAMDAALGAECSIIAPNLEECEELIRRKLTSDAEIIEAGHELLDKVRIVLITMGGDGAYCFTRGGAWHGAVSIEHVENTVGAGDAFLAGFSMEYSDGAALDTCLKTAVACGAASTLMRWAGELDAEAMHKIAKQVVIREVE